MCAENMKLLIGDTIIGEDSDVETSIEENSEMRSDGIYKLNNDSLVKYNSFVNIIDTNNNEVKSTCFTRSAEHIYEDDNLLVYSDHSYTKKQSDDTFSKSSTSIYISSTDEDVFSNTGQSMSFDYDNFRSNFSSSFTGISNNYDYDQTQSNEHETINTKEFVYNSSETSETSSVLSDANYDNTSDSSISSSYMSLVKQNNKYHASNKPKTDGYNQQINNENRQNHVPKELRIRV